MSDSSNQGHHASDNVLPAEGLSRRLCMMNLWRGGTGRADPIAEVLLAQDSLAWVLAEATDDEVVERLATRFSDGAGGKVIRCGDWAVISRAGMTTPAAGPATGAHTVRLSDVATLLLIDPNQGPLDPPEGGGTLPVLIARSGTQDIVVHAGWEHCPTGPTYPTVEPAIIADAWMVIAGTPPSFRTRMETDRLAVYASCHFPITIEWTPGSLNG
jgi:hypothetical protein